MKSFFSSPSAKNTILEMYYNKLDELPINYEFQKIETSFGDTNIILTGENNNPPLVLIHGSNGCAPIALEAMLDLEKNFRIYAIDVVAQPNLSEGIRPNMKDHAYGQWMFEILTRLNIQDAIMVGISFGGFITWKTLVFDSRRISRAFLIVPAGIVNGNPLKAMWNVFLPMKLYQWSKNQKYVQQFLNKLFTEPDEFTNNYLAKVFLDFEMDFSSISLITEEEAKKIMTPIHIIGADNDLLFPGEKMLERAKEIFPSLHKSILLKKSKHVPCQMDNQLISKLILAISHKNLNKNQININHP